MRKVNRKNAKKNEEQERIRPRNEEHKLKRMQKIEKEDEKENANDADRQEE